MAKLRRRRWTSPVQLQEERPEEASRRSPIYCHVQDCSQILGTIQKWLDSTLGWLISNLLMPIFYRSTSSYYAKSSYFQSTIVLHLPLSLISEPVLQLHLSLVVTSTVTKKLSANPPLNPNKRSVSRIHQMGSLVRRFLNTARSGALEAGYHQKPYFPFEELSLPCHYRNSSGTN
jgi:hypothetical protein